AFPETHAQLRPRVVAYTAQMFDNMVGYEIPVMRFLVTLLLVVICANVAILVYARTATRRSEITVRSALGASRRRIVTQLFVEALVLSAGAAAVGTGIAALVLAYLDAWLSGPAARFGGLPFWMEFRLSSGTVFFVLALMLLGAVIVGVVPALKATGGRLQPRLNALGGGTGMRMGRTWTFLIVAQVAFVVAALPIALYSGWDFARHGMADPGFAAEEFVAASLIMDREASPAEEREAEDRAFDLRYAAAHAELTRRLEVEPAVAGVTFTAHLPGMEPTVRVEVEGMPLDTLARAPAGSASGHSARSGAVDLEFFETFDVPVLGGRAFNPADIGAGSAPVIVNRAFVQQILGGGVALERRIRYVSGYRSGGVMRDPDNVEMEQWYEIVGVVGDLPGNPMEPGATQAMLYHPAAHGDLYPPVLALRVREGSAALFAGRLREITTAIDPTLRLFDLRPLDEILGQWQGGMRLAALAILLVTLSVLLLSSAGIYALMSFTVAQRRKEIGIRAALGADRRHILMGVFSRAAGQLAAGAALGLVAAALIDRLAGGLIVGGDGMIVLPAVAVLMVVIGLLGALGPARSGLRIQPTEALKGDV
ncbi:MAG: FtsX-like permease family protein, partial [Phycisphaeraceae bacterium]